LTCCSPKSPELVRKAKERLPNIAVLFASGYSENAIMHGGRLDASVDLLPYTRDALAGKIPGGDYVVSIGVG
jgi:hypothetical protein